MKFHILVPHVVEIPASTVESIFLSVCDDFADAGVMKNKPMHVEDILIRAKSQHGIDVPEGYKFDEGEENEVTLGEIRAAKRKEK